jgi:hypothetical protein
VCRFRSTTPGSPSRREAEERERALLEVRRSGGQPFDREFAVPRALPARELAGAQRDARGGLVAGDFAIRPGEHLGITERLHRRRTEARTRAHGLGLRAPAGVQHPCGARLDAPVELVRLDRQPDEARVALARGGLALPLLLPVRERAPRLREDLERAHDAACVVRMQARGARGVDAL